MPGFEVSAEVISCPGRLGDIVFYALQVNLEGFSSPYVLTMSLPRVCSTALSEQIDPVALYEALAEAVNKAKVKVPSLQTQTAETASPAMMT